MKTAGNDPTPSRRLRLRGDDGVALIEFAIVVPVLFLILFGIIEFGWGFYQNMDVRHGAREGMRLAAVNATPSNAESSQGEKIARETCNRMDEAGTSAVSITLNSTLVSDPSGDTVLNDIGDEVTVLVERDLDTLTGFLDWAIGGITLRSSVTTRLEQPATYSNVSAFAC